MQPVKDAVVYVVDDDVGVRDALAWLLRSRHLTSEVFDSAPAVQQALLQSPPSQPCCLLLDVRMPDMSGLALFDWLVQRQLHQAMPVIFLTGHADVPTAVDAVKRGAFDFCEKPFSDNALVDRIEQALAQSEILVKARREQVQLRQRLADLTERERDVMRWVVEGLPNKLIADRLDISVRTVEVHRARVFEKMAAKSAVELANMLRNQ
ncbi:response regulator transcription factor [Rhodoferax sp.]|uniref:response regulator transcription factor n=1 Tax=Rhodoferax sp. TaxID=50421 RepID=UPI00275A7D8C|nr:response regulator [Rhodoferax sp.]